MRIRKDRGVTLIELLLAVTVLVAAGTAVTSIWFASDRSYRVGASVAEAQAEARRAMETIERDIRAGIRESVFSEGTPVDTDGDGTIEYTDYSDFEFCTFEPGSGASTSVQPTRIRYSLDENTNAVVREVVEGLGTTRRIARNVSAIEFRGTAGYVNVSLAIDADGIVAPLATNVAFRTAALDEEVFEISTDCTPVD